MTIVEIARICHEANRAYCQTLGDNSQVSWDEAPQWQKFSAISGVEFHQKHTESKPSDSHNSWLAVKLQDGWKYGKVKDPEKKEHPCVLPFESLPREQQTKDVLFLSICRALLPLV